MLPTTPAPSRWPRLIGALLTVAATVLLAVALAADTRASRVPDVLGIALQAAPAADHDIVQEAAKCPFIAARTGPKSRIAMRCAIAAFRRAEGLAPLRLNLELNRSARRKTRDLLRCGFSHRACGHGLTIYPRREGYMPQRGSWLVAENLAWGTRDRGSALSVFAMWLASPPHRELLTDSTVRDVGLGAVSARTQPERFAATATVWTLHAGCRQGCPAP